MHNIDTGKIKELLKQNALDDISHDTLVAYLNGDHRLVEAVKAILKASR